MPGEDIRLGPFVGGLNTLSDPSSISDVELAELVNFELDVDGALVSRPPITNIEVKYPLSSVPAVQRRNLIANPNSELEATFNSNLYQCIAYRTALTARGGRYSTAVEPSVEGTIGAGTTYRTAGAPVVAGKKYMARLYIRNGAITPSRSMRFRVDWYDASGNTLTPSDSPLYNTTTAWKEYFLTPTAPANAAFAAIRFVVYGTQFDDIFYLDAAHLEDFDTWDPAYPRFDGSHTDTDDLIFGWEGATHNSISTLARPVYTGSLYLLGYFVAPGGASYLIGSDKATKTYYFDGTSWILITDTFGASAMCQFRDKAWLVAPVGSSNPGGTWSPSAGFAAVSAMPRGACIVAHKERLWLGAGKNATTNGTRLYVTDIVDGAPSWGGNFIDIGPGDGQNIVDLTVYFSDIVIFKQASTHRFSFDADPSVGIITRVSDSIGVADVNCFASYENELYVLFDNKVYMFTNYNYNRLNLKVPLKASNPSISLSEYASISVWADRIFVAFYDKMYVYSLRTRTWSEWRSETLSNIGRVVPVPNQQGVTPVAYTYSTKPGSPYLYRIKDAVTATDAEEMTCSFQTKNYDYQTAQRYKRLFWWGVDAFVRTSLAASVLPVSHVAGVTWNQLKAYTWEALKDNTWDRPLDVSLVIADTVTTQGLTGGRKFIKFLKSLRFRQVAFRIEVKIDGTSSTSPARIYSLMTYIKDKQGVSKRIS